MEEDPLRPHACCVSTNSFHNPASFHTSQWNPVFHLDSCLTPTSLVLGNWSVHWGGSCKPQAMQNRGLSWQTQPRGLPLKETGGPLKQTDPGLWEVEWSEIRRGMGICIHKPIFKVPVECQGSSHHPRSSHCPKEDYFWSPFRMGPGKQGTLLRVYGAWAMEDLLHPCHFCTVSKCS